MQDANPVADVTANTSSNDGSDCTAVEQRDLSVSIAAGRSDTESHAHNANPVQRTSNQLFVEPGWVKAAMGARTNNAGERRVSQFHPRTGQWMVVISQEGGGDPLSWLCSPDVQATAAENV